MSNDKIVRSKVWIILKDILKVASSNIVKLITGVLVGFLLPKILGVEDYGYYKTFTLYVTYVGVFALGINDGIYLKYGGINYEHLNKNDFSIYSKLFFLIESFFFISTLVVSIIILQGEMQFIFIAWSAYMLFSNIISYLQTISQITSRFSELAWRNIVLSILSSISILFFWFYYKLSGEQCTYRLYTIIYVLIMALLAIWYINTYKEILIHKCNLSKQSMLNIIEFSKIGFPLMVANLSSSIILSLDRQFVSVLFDTKTYAIYAFAYNMLSLITTATSAISMVLYPTLKRTTYETMKKNYPKMISIILILVFYCLVCYFPLCWFIRWFLPAYEGALIVFRVILPGLALSSAITIVIHNYYKVIGKNTLFFVISIIVLGVSAVANYIAYMLFKSTISISIASIVVMLLWYLISDYYLVRKFKIQPIKNNAYIILMGIGFYVITTVDTSIISMFLYLIYTTIISMSFYHKEIVPIVKKYIAK